MKTAGDLVIGDKVYERDGFEFTVTKVEKRGGKVLLELHSDFASVQPLPVLVKANKIIKD